jgi:hypothetical protein
MPVGIVDVLELVNIHMATASGWCCVGAIDSLEVSRMGGVIQQAGQPVAASTSAVSESSKRDVTASTTDRFERWSEIIPP